jgi:hypothetical protein
MTQRPIPPPPHAVIASCAFAVSKQSLPEGKLLGLDSGILSLDRGGQSKMTKAGRHLGLGVDVKQVPIHRHEHTGVSFITDFPIIAGMTPDPTAYRASMFAVAGYKDYHHRRELCKRQPLVRTIDRAPPQPCIRAHQAENEWASRPPSFPRSNRLPASSLPHAGVQRITCRMLFL